MKKILVILLLSSSVCFGSEKEKIVSFDSYIIVNEDSSLRVTEEITVIASQKKIKRGIYRDFPTRYKGKYGAVKNAGFKIIEVLKDGLPEPYHTENIFGGKRIYIGEENRYIPKGEHTYTITYETTRQIRYFDDYDELYWNVTGNNWNFEIDNAYVKIKLPEGAEIINKYGYTGHRGEKGQEFAEINRGLEQNELKFRTSRKLNENEGFTIAVSFPKGTVYQPTKEERRDYFIKDNWGLLTSIALFIGLLFFYFLAWIKVGKDPDKGEIYPCYYPPKDISPARVRYLINMKIDDKCFTAAIISIAIKGLINIREVYAKELVSTQLGKSCANKLASTGQGNAYALDKNSDDTDKLSIEEVPVFQNLLGNSDSIELTRENRTKIYLAKKYFEKTLKKEGKKLFKTNSFYLLWGILMTIASVIVLLIVSPVTGFMTIWTSFFFGIPLLIILSALHSIFTGKNKKKSLLAILPIFLFGFALYQFVKEVDFGFFIQDIFAELESIPQVFMVIMTIILNPIFAKLLKAPTKKGRKFLDEIEGFKMFLANQEKGQIERFNAPTRNMALFEKYLPYAVALDLENEWGEQFTDIISDSLSVGGGSGYRYWYHGHHRSYSGIASAISSGISTAVSTSSSGSSGGGCSGGGGGGGGGGGW